MLTRPKTRDRASTRTLGARLRSRTTRELRERARIKGYTHLRRRDKLLDADPRLIERAGTLRDSLSSHHTNRMLALSSAHAKGYLLRTRTPGLRHPLRPPKCLTGLFCREIHQAIESRTTSRATERHETRETRSSSHRVVQLFRNTCSLHMKKAVFLVSGSAI